MSDTGNPWQSPDTEATALEAESRKVLTPLMVHYLKGASPWIRFMGVLSYIGAALLVLTGIIFIVMMVRGSSLFNTGFFNAASVAYMGGIYLVMGALAFFPAHFTYSFGAKIRHYLLGDGEKDLEEALRNNRALWKFNGILVIVCLSFSLLILIVSVATVFASAF
ncbi:MAG: hypothetical protein LBL56_01640 [Treponema sp.]|jgi:hypothetical protein|nr:hypothetical protein [Treponema sp.]